MADAGLDSADQVRLLASSIAHGFNNALGALLLHLAIAKMQAEPGQEILTTLSDAENVALRAQGLTQQLLALAGPDVVVRRVTSIGGLLRASTDATAVGSAVACAVTVPEDLWPVECDPGQLSYAVSHLVQHAAATLRDTGTVVLTAANVRLAPDQIPGLTGGRWVAVTIEAAGPGGGAVRAELELAAARARWVVDKHEGGIVDEAAGPGRRRLAIYLPAAAPVLRAGPPRRERSLRVLVMDDEGLMRTAARDVLVRLGHRVETAQDGAEAIASYRRAHAAGTPFDVVILDLTVAGSMGGREAIRELQALDPGVRAIVSTGYTNDPVVEDFRAAGFRATLLKPYRIADLQEALRLATAEGEA